MLETDHLQKCAQTGTESYNIPDTVLTPQIEKQTDTVATLKELRVQARDRPRPQKKVIDYKITWKKWLRQMYRVWWVRRGNPSNPERSGDCLKWKKYVNCFEGPTGAPQITGNNLGKEIGWERISHVAGMRRGRGLKAGSKSRKATQARTGLWATVSDDVQGTVLLSSAEDRKIRKCQ